MTDIDYEKLKESTDSIIKNVENFLADIDLEKLTKLKKKLRLVKAIISDVSKINEYGKQNKKGFDPLMLAMMVASQKANLSGLSSTDKDELWDMLKNEINEKEE